MTRTTIIAAVLTAIATAMMLVGVWLAVSLIDASKARAHDWYPTECCSGLDCAPVDKAEVLQSPAQASMLGLFYSPPIAPGSIMVTSKHGTAVVPPNMVRRESKDHRMHVCISGGRVICVFFPPGI